MCEICFYSGLPYTCDLCPEDDAPCYFMQLKRDEKIKGKIMAYKIGTYKLNLGLDENEKMKLDFIQASLESANYSKTVRLLIEHYYEHFNSDSGFITPPGYSLVRTQDLSDLRVHLETCAILNQKLKEDIK